MRKAEIERNTSETQIKVKISLEGSGKSDISTGVGFFDHMLEAFAKHSGFDVSVEIKGDLGVDCHHTVEDAGICLGQAFAQALGDKSKIARYGSFYVPMDESLAFASVDIGGRAYFVFNGEFFQEKIGDFDTVTAVEFFRAFAFNALITLHLSAIYGENDHHKVEALFKALANALRIASAETNETGIKSTKGML